uniref:Intraflagellar transport protein 46 homolog n=1 Tax=Schistosoma haematobium TaxID=6185 RepID=A0A095A0R1_SCHHA
MLRGVKSVVGTPVDHLDSHRDNSKSVRKIKNELLNKSIKTAPKSIIEKKSNNEKSSSQVKLIQDEQLSHSLINKYGYTPQTIELETKLKPFIPDYIPAVGDIDAFLKVPRPDGKPDYLGLLVLDEPCANQSDPTVLNLQLRALSKQTATKQVIVKSIENAEQQTKVIENWIKSITDLYRAKPAPTVHYTRNMPEISELMAVWPTSFEETINNMQLSLSQLDCSLKDYVDIICAFIHKILAI